MYSLSILIHNLVQTTVKEVFDGASNHFGCFYRHSVPTAVVCHYFAEYTYEEQLRKVHLLLCICNNNLIFGTMGTWFFTSWEFDSEQFGQISMKFLLFFN
jgi:hypothetical protein